MFQSSSIEEDQQMHEIPDDHSQIENEPSQVKNEEQMTETVCLYETRIEGENESTPQEEISYQETFIDERPVQHTELDLWLNSLKQTLLVSWVFENKSTEFNFALIFQSFPKLMRARAKKNINDIVSDLEIAYLEAIEIDRSQSSWC